MKTKIISTYSIKDLLEKINSYIAKGNKPTLAFVYASVKYDIRQLVVELNKCPFEVFGATTVGEVFADKNIGAQSLDESIVCMLTDMNPEAFAFKFIPTDVSRSYEIGKSIGEWATSHFPDTAIITATSGLDFDNDAYTQGILSGGVDYAFGGLAGDDLILKDTYVFSKDNFSTAGIVAIAIDRTKINISGSRAFGWSGIGKERIVTKADKNIVYEVDNKPAIDFYRDYLHVTPEDMPQMGIEYPFEVTMRNGQVVYRAVLSINEEDGSLIFAGHVEEKSRVRISAPAGKGIIDHVAKSVKEAREESPAEPELVLVFPCFSRKQVLGEYTIKEIEAAYNAAQAPLIGFFAYGEIGAFPGGYGFHNETFVTALLSEKEK